MVPPGFGGETTGPVSDSIRRRARLAICRQAAADRPTMGAIASKE
jgi:hypothetical protein